MKERLTNPRIASFICPEGKQQVFLQDAEAPGLAVRAVSGGKKTFIFERSFKGKTVRMTMGDVRAWNIDDARKWAREQQQFIDQGVDPRTVAKMKPAEEPTADQTQTTVRSFGELMEAYRDWLLNNNKSQSAIDTCKSVFKNHVPTKVKKMSLAEVTAFTLNDEIFTPMVKKGIYTTAGHLRAFLSSAYSLAMRAPFDAGLLEFKGFEVESNPVLRIKKPKAPPRLIAEIIEDQDSKHMKLPALRSYVAALLEQGDDVAESLLFMVLGGGQRKQQALRLTASGYDSNTGTAVLWDPKGRTGMEPRRHPVVVGPFLKGLLDRRTSGLEPNERVFSCHYTTAGDRISAIAKVLKINASQLTMRRGIETLLTELKVDKETRAQILSHDCSDVSDRFYQFSEFEERKREALTKLEQALLPTDISMM